MERSITLPILPAGPVVGIRKNFTELSEGAAATFDVVLAQPDGTRLDRMEDLQRVMDGTVAGSTVAVDRSIDLPVQLPAHRLMPVALVAPDRGTVVAPVCSARTLAEGRPPLGIAIAQQDVARVYPLAEEPESCLTDFLATAADHAREMAQRLEHQEASVQRFLELSGDDEA